MKVLLGVELGFFVHLLAAGVGFTALLLAIPAAYNAMRFAGGAYLLYIAFKVIRNPHNWSREASSPSESTSQLIAKGFLTNVLNPKTATFYLSVFPQFITPHSTSILGQTMLLGAIHITVSSLCNMVYVLGAGSLAGFLQKHPTWERIQRWLFGTLIGLFAVKILTQKRLSIAPAR